MDETACKQGESLQSPQIAFPGRVPLACPQDLADLGKVLEKPLQGRLGGEVRTGVPEAGSRAHRFRKLQITHFAITKGITATAREGRDGDRPGAERGWINGGRRVERDRQANTVISLQRVIRAFEQALGFCRWNHYDHLSESLVALACRTGCPGRRTYYV